MVAQPRLFITGSGAQDGILRMPAVFDATPEDMPPATVELDALRVLVEAYIAAEGREKGQRLLSEAARIMALTEECETVVEFLPTRQREQRARVRRQTAAWFRKSLPVWVSRLTAM